MFAVGMATLYAALVFAFVDNHIIPAWHGIALALLSPISVFVSTRGNTIFYTPLVFNILYLVGFPLKLAWVIPRGHYHGAVGSFGFTASEWSGVVTVVLCGMLGIMVGHIVMKDLVSQRKAGTPPATNHDTIAFRPRQSRLYTWIFLWFFSSIGLSMLMWFLGIGQSGITVVQELPYRITGIMFYVRGFIVPAIGIFLIDTALKNQKYIVANLLAFLIIIESMVFGITAISRGPLVLRILPLFLYLFIGRSRDEHARRLVLRLMIVGGLVALALIPMTTGIRHLVFGTGGHVDITEFLSIIPLAIEETRSSWDLGEAAFFFLDRVVGLEGVMAVTAYPLHGVDLLIGMLTDAGVNNRIVDDVWGFSQGAKGGIFTGTGIGLFGFLYISGNLGIVFLGSAAAVAVGIVLEDVTRKAMFPPNLFTSVSATFGVLLSFEIWEINPIRIRHSLIIVLVGVLFIRSMIRGEVRRWFTLLRYRREQLRVDSIPFHSATK